MAVSFVAAGAADSGPSGTTPGAPAGIVTDDILILHIEGEGEDADADGGPTDWNLIGSVASATDGAADRTRHTLYWIRYNSGSPPSYSVPSAGNHAVSIVTAWRGCLTSATPIHLSQSSFNATNDTSVSITGLTTTVDNCMIVWSSAAGDDNGSAGSVINNAWGNTTLGAPADCANAGTTSGSDGSIRVAYSLMSGQGSTGTTTSTTAASEEEANWCVALLPEPFTLAGSVPSVSTVAGAVDQRPALVAADASVSTLTADLEGVPALVAVATSVSALSGDLEVSSASTFPRAFVLAGAPVYFTRGIRRLTPVTILTEVIVDLDGPIDAVSALAAALDNRPALAAQITAVSTLAGSLASAMSIASTVTSVSTLAGVPAVSQALAASAASLSTLAGAIASDAELAGASTSVSALAGELEQALGLAANAAAVSAAAGQMAVATGLATNAAAVSAAAGALALASALAAELDAFSGVAGAVGVATGLTGQIDALSTVAGTMPADDPNFLRISPLTGTPVYGWKGIRSLNQWTVPQNAPVELEGSLAALSSVTALLGLGQPLTGAVPSVSTLTGVGVLSQGLAGVTPAVSALTGAATLLNGLSASLASLSTLTGQAGLSTALAAELAAASSLAGLAGVNLAIASQLAVISALTGQVGNGIGISGSLASVSTLTGEALTIIQIEGALAALSEIAGAAGLIQGLDAESNTLSDLAGILALNPALGGSIEALSALVGDAGFVGSLAGAIASDSSAQALLGGLLAVRGVSPSVGLVLPAAVWVDMALAGQLPAVNQLIGDLLGATPTEFLSLHADFLQVISAMEATPTIQAALSTDDAAVLPRNYPTSLR